MTYQIIKDTSEYFLVWKPPNLPTTPTKSNPDCLISQVVEDFPNLKNVEGYKKQGEYGLLNRLDNKTAGIVVIAKSDISFNSLRNKLKSSQKVYLGFCHNLGNKEQGNIAIPIAHHYSDSKRMVLVIQNQKLDKFRFRGKPQKCETNFEKILKNEAERIWKMYLPSHIEFPIFSIPKSDLSSYTWIKCNILSGKRHQIRLHLKFVKYPIFGEDLYIPKTRRTKLIDHYALYAIGIEDF